MRIRPLTPLLGYAVALAASGLAGILTKLVSPLLGNTSFFEFFHAAVVLSAFYGGLGPGLLAAVVSFLTLDYFFIPPLNAFALGPHLTRLALFAAVAVLTSLLSARLRAAARFLERAHAELEERIGQRTRELSQANARLVKEIAQRREAERAILEISTREQNRLGQDLHDGLCQTLAGLRLMVEDLKGHATEPLPRLDAIEAQLTEALEHAYTVSRGLYPVELETNGLMSALQELSGRVSTIHPVMCRFRCARPVAIHDNAVATHLYRIAQEAIVNAIKGGKASRILVNLSRRGSTVVLSVADNGTGLDLEAVPRGMGLTLMRHRARMINADLGLRSRRRRGTVVTCSFTWTGQASGDDDGE